jgi:hypothetical protein
LSVLVGVYLHAIFTDSIAWTKLPTAIAWAPVAPLWLRGVLASMACGCIGVAIVETLALGHARPKPLHVSVRLKTSVEDLWRVTQDHALHPRWDHRFSRIVMLAPKIEEGTEMIYEKEILGVTIKGNGRYKHHRPLVQSTFEFWSDDPRSLIARGVGLWRYLPGQDGTVELTTSYTYDVRWGSIGRAVDRVFFRPAFQRATERSFARLAAIFFPDGASKVAGARGRKRAAIGAT